MIASTSEQPTSKNTSSFIINKTLSIKEEDNCEEKNVLVIDEDIEEDQQEVYIFSSVTIPGTPLCTAEL